MESAKPLGYASMERIIGADSSGRYTSRQEVVPRAAITGETPTDGGKPPEVRAYRAGARTVAPWIESECLRFHLSHLYPEHGFGASAGSDLILARTPSRMGARILAEKAVILARPYLPLWFKKIAKKAVRGIKSSRKRYRHRAL